MDRDRLEGRWHQVKGIMQEFWGELSGREADWIAGRRDQLIGQLEERYGMSHEEAEREVDRYIDRVI